MVAKKIEASGAGVLSLYVIEGAVVAVVVTRALALVGNGFALAVAACAAVVLALWATGWPTWTRAKELDADAAQRALHPGSTFKGRIPPRGVAGVGWQIARVTVGALFGAQQALYEKTRVVFRPPLVVVWLAVSVAAIAFLPMRTPVEKPKPAVVEEAAPAPEAELDRYACPKGSERLGKAPPDGHEMWCERGGAKHGPYRKWHDDAGERLAVEGNYVDGERDGMWRAWYSSGAKQNEGAFKKGHPDGHHLGWNEQGKKILDVTYEDGHEVKR